MVFFLSFVDPESQPGDLQRKLEILNGIMTNDRRHRQAQYLGNCKKKIFFHSYLIYVSSDLIFFSNFFHTHSLAGYSEDSDYTSDLNYPIGHNANSSASHYRNLPSPQPQRSLETSRENSYEKDDRSFYDNNFDSKQQMVCGKFLCFN